jgi:N-acetylglucosaminyldiphosphoundecaprenol N-acetyl-beta-D-mannosaminyltransferase
MQHSGLEWAFRLASEPRRLAKRYLIDDLPFAAGLLASCTAQRLRQGRPS